MHVQTNLHRAGKRADWELVPVAKRNYWQRIAAATKGVVTPANVISVLGAALVGVGLWFLYKGDWGWSLVFIAVGRLADVLDGAVAQATGTKSQVGEAVDAGLDKVIVIAALVVFLATGAVPLVAALLIGARNIITMALGLLGKAHRRAIHPTRQGKQAVTAEWVAILLFIAATAFTAQGWLGLATAARVPAYIALGIAMWLGIIAIRQYALAASGKVKI